MPIVKTHFTSFFSLCLGGSIFLASCVAVDSLYPHSIKASIILDNRIEY